MCKTPDTVNERRGNVITNTMQTTLSHTSLDVQACAEDAVL